MKLTKKYIDSLKYEGNGKSQFIKWDDDLKGFGLRVFPTGRKSFVLSYRSSGRKHIMTLGQFGVLTVDQGRKLAREKLVDVNKGGDPLEEKKKINDGEFVKDLCKSYMERHALPHKETWKTDQNRIDRYIIPFLGNLKVKAVTHSDVASLHRKIGETWEAKVQQGKKKVTKTIGGKYEANRVVKLISKMFDCARAWGFVDHSNPNPAKDTQYFKEESRDRYVSHEELPRLAEEIDKLENVYARNALWMYLLLGVRRSELLSAKWEDIDFERKELRVPKTKSGKSHYVPLSQAAITILENLPKLANNPFVFCGKNEGRPIVNIDNPWRRVRKNAGCPDVRLHDLRRTLGSWLAQSGNSLHLIGRVLNHSRPSTTAVYSRFGQDHVRQALESHGQQIMGVAGKTPKAQIVEIDEIKKKRK
jgi:integrase